MYQALGFDLDNTLYDQSQHLRSFFRVAGRWVNDASGVPARTAEEAFISVWERRTMACPFLFDEALQDLGVWRPKWVQELVKRYRSHRCALTLYDGVRTALERLSDYYALFLITDGNAELQRFKVEQLGLSDLFRCRIFTGDFGPEAAKPAPFAFLRAAGWLDLPPSLCLFVGDDPERDIAGARGAGMAAARVLSGPYRYQRCVPPADALVRNMRELETLLDASRETVSRRA